MKKKDTIKDQEIQSIFSNELLEESIVNSVPKKFKLVKKYPLQPPFSYANILYDENKSSYQYFIDEIKLNHDEEKIFKNLHSFLEQSLDSLDPLKANTNFDQHLNNVIKQNEKFFQTSPIVSIAKVKYYLKRDVLGYGIIDPLMHDHNLEDISCSGIGIPIYVWHRNYDSIQTNIRFDSEDELNSFISKIVFRSGKHVSTAFPISDLAIPGNHRISVLYQKEVTPRGTSFTIRKFKEDPYTIVDLIGFGTMDLEISAYLWMLVEAKMSIMIMGSTGSGKTTMLNEIAGLTSTTNKIFSVEDVAEINIPHENWFGLISRQGFGPNNEGEIGLYDLIKSSVRHRPDYIIVGEIRGSEAYVMFQAMATGHGGLCTMHADSFESASKRLQQKPMNIPLSYLSLMNCALIIRRVKDQTTGQSIRRTIAVEEISSNASPKTIATWKPKSDYYECHFNESENLKKISEQSGIEFDEILVEHSKRVSILKWLSSHNIRSHKQVSEMITKYNIDPNSVLQKINFEVS